MTPILPTAEEAAQIRAGNKELQDRYYVQNYDFVCTVCRSYFRHREGCEDMWQDAANECYFYFTKFKFINCFTFARSIKDICVFVRFGGEKSYHQYRQGNTEILTILDEPIARERRHGGAVETFGETLESDFDIMDEVDPPEDFCDKVHDIVAAYLTPRQSQAFDYFYYTNMTAREVGAAMGLGLNGAQSLRYGAREKLKKNAVSILELLRDIGYPVEHISVAE